jgi:hypothetical protein
MVAYGRIYSDIRQEFLLNSSSKKWLGCLMIVREVKYSKTRLRRPWLRKLHA